MRKENYDKLKPELKRDRKPGDKRKDVDMPTHIDKATGEAEWEPVETFDVHTTSGDIVQYYDYDKAGKIPVAHSAASYLNQSYNKAYNEAAQKAAETIKKPWILVKTKRKMQENEKALAKRKEKIHELAHQAGKEAMKHAMNDDNMENFLIDMHLEMDSRQAKQSVASPQNLEQPETKPEAIDIEEFDPNKPDNYSESLAAAREYAHKHPDLINNWGLAYERLAVASTAERKMFYDYHSQYVLAGRKEDGTTDQALLNIKSFFENLVTDMQNLATNGDTEKSWQEILESGKESSMSEIVREVLDNCAISADTYGGDGLVNGATHNYQQGKALDWNINEQINGSDFSPISESLDTRGSNRGLHAVNMAFYGHDQHNLMSQQEYIDPKTMNKDLPASFIQLSAPVGHHHSRGNLRPAINILGNYRTVTKIFEYLANHPQQYLAFLRGILSSKQNHEDLNEAFRKKYLYQKMSKQYLSLINTDKVPKLSGKEIDNPREAFRQIFNRDFFIDRDKEAAGEKRLDTEFAHTLKI